MTTSPGPVRRALASGITPAAYGSELHEAMETFAWLDRVQAHRVRGPRRAARDPRMCAVVLLVSQHASATNLGDTVAAEYVRDALESLVGCAAAHRALRDGAR